MHVYIHNDAMASDERTIQLEMNIRIDDGALATLNAWTVKHWINYVRCELSNLCKNKYHFDQTLYTSVSTKLFELGEFSNKKNPSVETHCRNSTIAVFLRPHYRLEQIFYRLERVRISIIFSKCTIQLLVIARHWIYAYGETKHWRPKD
jgi:hypothetical protein